MCLFQLFFQLLRLPGEQANTSCCSVKIALRSLGYGHSGPSQKETRSVPPPAACLLAGDTHRQNIHGSWIWAGRGAPGPGRHSPGWWRYSHQSPVGLCSPGAAQRSEISCSITYPHTPAPGRRSHHHSNLFSSGAVRLFWVTSPQLAVPKSSTADRAWRAPSHSCTWSSLCRETQLATPAQKSCIFPDGYTSNDDKSGLFTALLWSFVVSEVQNRISSAS